MTKIELESYYSANFTNLVKKVYRSCGNYHDAEDVVQEAFERATKYAESCRNVDKWFYMILRNAYRDYLNANKNWPLTKNIDDHVNDVDPVVIDYLKPQLIRQVFRTLVKEKEPNKTVLTLHIKYGFTQGEISQLVTGVTVKKASNIIFNFKRRLIKDMQ